MSKTNTSKNMVMKELKKMQQEAKSKNKLGKTTHEDGSPLTAVEVHVLLKLRLALTNAIHNSCPWLSSAHQTREFLGEMNFEELISFAGGDKVDDLCTCDSDKYMFLIEYWQNVANDVAEIDYPDIMSIIAHHASGHKYDMRLTAEEWADGTPLEDLMA